MPPLAGARLQVKPSSPRTSLEKGDQVLRVNLGGGLAAAGAGLGAGLLFGIPLIPPGAGRAAPAGCSIKLYYAA